MLDIGCTYRAWRDPGSGDVRHGTDVGKVSLTGRCPRARGHTRGIIPGSFMCYYSCLWSSCFFPVAARTMAVSGDFVSPGMKRPLEAHPGATVTLQSLIPPWKEGLETHLTA